MQFGVSIWKSIVNGTSIILHQPQLVANKLGIIHVGAVWSELWLS